MKQRCNRPAHTAYARYGGRGIKVCEAWEDFPTFASWATAHGYEDTLQIDRIDNDKGYCPENCRFVPPEVNANNRTCTPTFNFFGERLTVAQASRKFGRSQGGISARLKKGMSPEAAITTPWLR